MNKNKKGSSDSIQISGTKLPDLDDNMAGQGDHTLGSAFRFISTILDDLDALVYVSDMETYELLYLNKNGRIRFGEPKGKLCYKVLQTGMKSPCDFCTNSKLINDQGMATGVYEWEFQDQVSGRWYECRDQAIPWIDGRLVRIEIATDITGKKNMEQELNLVREKLEQSARIDSMLGCLNYRAFIEQAGVMLSHCKRHASPMSLIIMDIDNFKKVNERFGHIVGDNVLISIVRVIGETLRESDVFARYGGEEFVLVLPDTETRHAIDLLYRIQEKLVNLVYDKNHPELTVTLSYGLTTIHLESMLDELLIEASEALSRAKERGMSRIEVFQEDEN